MTDFVADCVTDFCIVLSYKSVGISFGVTYALSICPTKRFPHRLERLKYTKIGHTIGHKIGHKIGHCFPGSRSKMIDLGVTQPDFQRV